MVWGRLCQSDRVTRDQLAGIYDDFADNYVANRDVFDLTKILDGFRSRLAATGDLCDLGCGAGVPVTKLFADKGWRVVGVDFSPKMLQLARTQVPVMTPVLADIREVSFREQSFDAVTAVYSLFHVPWTEHEKIFANIRVWLRPGGSLLFTYATKEYTGHDEFSGTKEFMGRSLFYSHTTPSKLREQLARAGLTIQHFDLESIGGETFLWVVANT